MLEDTPGLICLGNEEIAQVKRQQGKNQGRDKVGQQQPPEADTTAQYSDDLGITCHFGCEKNDRNKREEINKQVDEVGNEVQVIVDDNGFQWCLVFYKTVKILRNVEYDHDEDQQGNSIEEGSKKLPDNVFVDDLQVMSLTFEIFL
jgi:hypothetical protein